MNKTWRSKDKLISDVLLWTSIHGRTRAGRPERTYPHQLCADTVCSLEDLPGAMDDRDGEEREREKGEVGESVLSARLDDDGPQRKITLNF